VPTKVMDRPSRRLFLAGGRSPRTRDQHRSASVAAGRRFDQWRESFKLTVYMFADYMFADEVAFGWRAGGLALVSLVLRRYPLLAGPPPLTLRAAVE